MTDGPCPYCHWALNGGADQRVCPRCGVPHHLDCWTEAEGCGELGCGFRANDPAPATAQISGSEQTSSPTPLLVGSSESLVSSPDLPGLLPPPPSAAPVSGSSSIPAAPVEAVTQKSDLMRFCTSCGAAFVSDDLFCTSCGAARGTVS